ncbi:alpha/beta hydrolase [Nocardia sp. CA-135398]|uniref:alpha/beta hydrolase n=1 Tax=Nocardia sp. CA-135398 TaxID=3239977 RepID=UPI003D982877
METAREDVDFTASSGATLRGWFYPQADTAPCVVLQHGFSGVKEFHLDLYAERFSAAGLACLVYDHPGFGGSDAAPGTPRQEVDPWQQIRHIQDAITYAQCRDEVDADWIGLWGSSYGGAHAYVTAAIDRRVKAVVSQVPVISGSRTFESLVPIGARAHADALFAADRQARMQGQDPMIIPIVDADPLANCVLPTPDSYEFFISTQAERAPEWRNETTVRSMELFRGYEPGTYLPYVSPTPLLMVVTPTDRIAASEVTLAAYEAAAQPKKLELIGGGHFDAYTGANFEVGSAAALSWFVEHLLEKKRASALSRAV